MLNLGVASELVVQHGCMMPSAMLFFILLAGLRALQTERSLFQ